jgi:hypothetical protein
MLRKSGIVAVFLVFGTCGLLYASAVPSPEEQAAAPKDAGSASLLPAEAAGGASCAASPLLSIGDMGRRNLDSCIPYGNTCDPRYVPNPVCCPGTTCQFLYPGVPLFCL